MFRVFLKGYRCKRVFIIILLLLMQLSAEAVFFGALYLMRESEVNQKLISSNGMEITVALANVVGCGCKYYISIDSLVRL